jgi:tetratricopeptide (TPR) repeat protein
MKDLFFLFLMAFSSQVHAGEPTQAQDYFNKGNQAYQASNYSEATKQYEAALQSGYHAPELYENLGHAYSKQNQIGKAILNYEKGLLMQPKNSSIQENLDFLKNKIGITHNSNANFLLLQWWIQLRNFFSPNIWSILTLLFAFVNFWLLYVILMKKNDTRPVKHVRYLYILIPLFLLNFLIAKNSTEHTNNCNEAIVIAKNTTLYTDPDPKTEAIEALQEGSKIIILDQIGAWTKAQLLTDEEGWLESGAVERI